MEQKDKRKHEITKHCLLFPLQWQYIIHILEHDDKRVNQLNKQKARRRSPLWTTHINLYECIACNVKVEVIQSVVRHNEWRNKNAKKVNSEQSIRLKNQNKAKHTLIYRCHHSLATFFHCIFQSSAIYFASRVLFLCRLFCPNHKTRNKNVFTAFFLLGGWKQPRA